MATTSASRLSRTLRSLRLTIPAAMTGGVVVGLMGGIVGLAACAGGSEVIREITYGPSFQYIDEGRLEESMWKLAQSVQDLDVTLNPETAISDDDRQTRVLAILEDMKAATAAVSAPGQNTNHENIDLHLDQFQLDIAVARTAADQRDYGPAKALPQACLNCHTGTGGGPQR